MPYYSLGSFRVEHTSRAEFAKYLDEIELGGSEDFDANDKYQQLKALIAFDLTRGTNLQDAAAKVKAKVFIISSLYDHMVNPIPALSFAKIIAAPTASRKEQEPKMRSKKPPGVLRRRTIVKRT